VRRCLALALLLVAGLASDAAAQGCDPIGTGNCLYPWPNDYFRTDGHLALTPSMMPANSSGVPIDPTDYNRQDGFSPGATIVLKVPGLDTPAALAQTGAVPITDLARTYDRRAPIVVINARTGRRHLIWAELDSNAGSPANTALLIHPGKNFREGERYIVALRRLRTPPASCWTRRSRSASTVTAPRRRIRPSSAGARTWRTSSGGSSGRGSSERASTWRGTSPWPASARCRAGCSRSATGRSPSSVIAT
jgi:hypothetical protein